MSYKSLFPAFSSWELDKTYRKLDIDSEIDKLFSGYKINTTEDQAALHHIYRSAYGKQVSNIYKNYYEITKNSILQCINLKSKLLQKNIKNIVTVGIGGSFEGPKLLLETLTKKHERSFNHIFLTGLDIQEFKKKSNPWIKQKRFLLFLQNHSRLMKLCRVLILLGAGLRWLKFKDHLSV